MIKKATCGLPCLICQTVIQLVDPGILPNNNYALHLILLNEKLDQAQRELVVVKRQLDEANVEIENQANKRLRLDTLPLYRPLPARRKTAAFKPSYNSSSSQVHQPTITVNAYGEHQQLLQKEPPKPPS